MENRSPHHEPSVSQVLFSERQRFRSPWLWILLLSLNARLILEACQEDFTGSFPFNLRQALAGVGLLATALIFCCCLDTLIKEDGIYVRFFPLHRTFRKYSPASLAKVYIREYGSLREYGGWGVCSGLSGNGRAYNVAGAEGIQLVFKDGSKLLIGTQMPAEAKQALRRAGYLTP
jgi:hypothetical protein